MQRARLVLRTPALGKTEVVKRTLDYLYVPLQFYIRSMLLRQMSETETNKMMEKFPGRVRTSFLLLHALTSCNWFLQANRSCLFGAQPGDVPHLFDLASKYRDSFPELAPYGSEAKCIRHVRNCWAHSEPFDDNVVIRFLIACEMIVSAICTEDTLASYQQIKAMRQCFIISYADKLLQEFASVDAYGNTAITYPVLMPAFEE